MLLVRARCWHCNIYNCVYITRWELPQRVRGWGHPIWAGTPLSSMRTFRGSAPQGIAGGWGCRWAANLDHSVGAFLRKGRRRYGRFWAPIWAPAGPGARIWADAVVHFEHRRVTKGGRSLTVQPSVCPPPGSQLRLENSQTIVF